MRRRELLLLGGAMMMAPDVRAQQKAMPVIGFRWAGSPGAEAAHLAAFRQGLSETGYVEGQTVAIEYRWAEGSFDRMPALAADLVGRKVDLIATSGPAVLAAKNATSTIPIVFAGVSDPVELGLVASLARPGGNITGFSTMGGELNPKRFELLSELVPRAGVIALLVNPNNPRADRLTQSVQEAARVKGGAAPYTEGRHRKRDRCRVRNPRRAACRRAIRRRRSVLLQPTRTAPDAGITPCRSSDLSLARVRGGRRPDHLWCEAHGHLSPSRPLRGENPERCQAG